MNEDPLLQFPEEKARNNRSDLLTLSRAPEHDNVMLTLELHNRTRICETKLKINLKLALSKLQGNFFSFQMIIRVKDCKQTNK